MKSRFWFAAIFTALAPLLAAAADEPKAPSTAKALWADFDPRKDALDAKTVREWEKDGIVYRYVTFHFGTSELQVTPYSVDADPRARFWRSAEAKKSGCTWTAKLSRLGFWVCCL